MLSERALSDQAKRAFQDAENRINAQTLAPFRRLIEDRQVRIKHRRAVQAIERLVHVDMTDPKNRKGAIAKALGLQVNTASKVMHLAISLCFDRLRDISTEDESKTDLFRPPCGGMA